jgi:hypothetical protein
VEQFGGASISCSGPLAGLSGRLALNARFWTETGLARRIELMTFCTAFARGQRFERSRIPCKRPVSSSGVQGGFAAGPVSVRREADAQADYAHEKGLQMQAFSRAADGIRTHDLLHGKQGAWFPSGADIPCKSRGYRVWVSFWVSPAFTASSREFGHRMGTRLAYSEFGDRWVASRACAPA